MRVSREITVYNQQNLAYWKEEAANLKPKIDSAQEQVRIAQFTFSQHEEQYIARLKEEMQRLEEESALQTALYEIKKDKEARKHHLTEDRMSSSHRKEDVRELEQDVRKEEELKADLRLLETKIAQKKPEWQRVKAEYDDAAANLERTQLDLRYKEYELKQYTTLIHESQFFLNKLRTQPEPLVNEIADKFIRAIDIFERTQAAGQSIEVRVALFELPNKINAIRNAESKNDYQRFALLVGLMWHTLNLADNKQAANFAFAETIMPLIRCCHISEEATLPDELANQCIDGTGKTLTCVEYFKDHRRVDLMAFYDITAEGLVGLEQKAYEAACSRELPQDCPHPEIFENLLKTLKLEAAKAHRDQTKLYTYAIDSSYDLIESIKDPKGTFPNKLERHQAFLAQVDGNHTCGRILKGILLAIGALALFAVSAATLIISHGASSPLSAYGIKTSGALAIAAISAVFGAASTYGAIRLFSLHGTAAAMSAIEAQAEKDHNAMRIGQR